MSGNIEDNDLNENSHRYFNGSLYNNELNVNLS